MAELDEKVCKQMEALVELLTTSGKPTLNPEIMKKFKKFCRISDAYVQHAFELLMKQLSVKHAEVRLSSFQMVDELFTRSHMFRELLLADFDTFLELAAGTEKKNPLPPPKAVAENMKNSVNRSILLWVEKFGHAYKKLTLGFEFLKNFKKIDFDSIQTTIDLERRQKEETERKLEVCRKEKLDEVNKEHSESELEIQLCLTEVENGLQLLMPRPDDFFISLTDETGTSTKSNSVTSTVTSSSQNGCTEKDNIVHSAINESCSDAVQSDKGENKIDSKHKHSDNKVGNAGILELNKEIKSDYSQEISGTDASEESYDDGIDDDDDDDEDDEFEEVDAVENGAFTQEHGLFDRKFALTVELGQSGSSLQETEDNRDLIQGVRDQYTLIKTKYLPAVKRWLQILTENCEKEEKIKQLTEVKRKLEDAVKKCVELEIARSKRNRDNESDSDEDDFEEVPEKEGYEEDVPEYIKMEAAMASTSKASKSTGRKKRTPKKAKMESKPAAKKLGMKNVKQMAKDILESQRLLDGDDFDSAMLKSQAVYAGQKSAKSSSCTASDTLEFMSQADTEEKHKTKKSQGSVHRTQTGTKNDSQSYVQTVKLETQSDNGTDSQSSSVSKTEAQSNNRTASSETERKGKEHTDENERKKSLMEEAPFVEFGVDLEHWENPDKIKAPVKNRFDDASRFWVPDREVDDQEPGGSEEVASLTRRSFTYVGEFEPVKWKCRAPLGDGRLCDRMDRVKCPFHGKIIGRDKEGRPTNLADVEQIYKDKIKKESDDTAGNSSESEAGSSRSKGKGQGKGKGKEKAKKRKYPNLTEIKESKHNSRTRLEAKIFNRSTLKKVNKALDAETLKKLSNKFSHQFNYSLK